MIIVFILIIIFLFLFIYSNTENYNNCDDDNPINLTYFDYIASLFKEKKYEIKKDESCLDNLYTSKQTIRNYNLKDECGCQKNLNYYLKN